MTRFDSATLAACVRTKRGDRSLRVVIDEVQGISLATLSRVENSKQPDMDTFLALCDWLEMAPATFFSDAPVQVGELDTIEQIERSLWAAPFLTPEFIHALMHLVKLFHRKAA